MHIAPSNTDKICATCAINELTFCRDASKANGYECPTGQYVSIGYAIDYFSELAKGKEK